MGTSRDPQSRKSRHHDSLLNETRSGSVWSHLWSWDAWIAVLWVVNLASLVPRQHLVLDYTTFTSLPPWMEPLAAPLGWVALAVLAMTGWWLRMQALKRVGAIARHRTWALWGLLPLAVNGLRSVVSFLPPASLLDTLWVAAFASLMAVHLWPHFDEERSKRYRMRLRSHYLILAILVGGCMGWWWYQSHMAYTRYQLGFNDFGHFTQRVASTANGWGWLRESPVLPPFWDHFNPGLLLLTPIWKLIPSVEVIFAVQAFCLAWSGVLVGRIARCITNDRWLGTVWTAVWLLHPSVSQMNLAYTYGWHPVTLAIPCLLYSALKTLRGQHSAALYSAILACTFEETVIVIVASVCAARGCGAWLATKKPNRWWHAGEWESLLHGKWEPGTWIWGAILSTIAFVLVYRFSGLAEFQTARFTALGDSPWEIVASPILRPSVFWGQLLSMRTGFFLACLFIPLAPWGMGRSLWFWLGAMVPLSVLLVWDHAPAKSLAFQYPATLLPVLFVGAIVASVAYQNGVRRSGLTWGALAASLILSMSVGAMPWSNPTLQDVLAITYGQEGIDSRKPDSAVHRWLEIELHAIRTQQASVLATGRIAAHLVGCREVETVSQFQERRSKLTTLTPDLHPLRRYAFLVLDRTERFQQSPTATEELLREALQQGFQVASEQEGISILERKGEAKGLR